MNRLISGNFRSDSGSVIVEFGFAVPLLIFCVFGLIELTRLSLQYQEIAGISREAANAAFRECATRGTQAAICANDIATRMQDIAAAAGLDVVVLIAILDSSTGVGSNQSSLTSDGAFLQVRGESTPTRIFMPQRYWFTTVANNTVHPLHDLLTDDDLLQNLTVAQVFTVYDPITNVVPGLEPRIISEVTIY